MTYQCKNEFAMEATLRQLIEEHARLHAERPTSGADASVWHAFGLDMLDEGAAAAALAAFARGPFLVFVGGRQISGLEVGVVLEQRAARRLQGAAADRLRS
jgi:hypothetical protein